MTKNINNFYYKKMQKRCWAELLDKIYLIGRKVHIFNLKNQNTKLKKV